MIDLYTGTPRSGKSYHAAQRICMRCRFGEPIVANFPCDLSRYKKANFTFVPNDKLTPDFLRQYALDYFGDRPVKEGGILLVIDEAQLLFNAREWQNRYRQNWLSFFTLHGKLGYDIVLITQMDRMLDKQIRGLVEYEYIHRRLGNFGWRGILLRLITLGAQFMSVKVWYPMNEKVDQEILRLSKKVYSIYNTHLLFDQEIKENVSEVSEIPEKTVVSSAFRLKQLKELILLRSKKLKMSRKKKMPSPKKRPSHLAAYLRPYDKKTFYSTGGKYLLPGGRSQTGWRS